MRKILLCGVLVAGAALAFSSQSCKGSSEPISGTCASFCGKLVDAMNDSDFYDLSHEGVSGTKKSCGRDCTEVVTEYNALDRGDMDECVSCMTDKGFNQIGSGATDVVTKSNWTIDALMADVGTDCAVKCDRADIEYTNDDGELMFDFLDDFGADFMHHYSGAVPFCDGYTGDNLCCKEFNTDGEVPCPFLTGNGVCDCGDNCSWDTGDCTGTDTGSDTGTDTAAYCAGYTGTDDCCTDADPCGYAGDGYCDCGGYCAWDATDCGA
jgi:hypothetical protein